MKLTMGKARLRQRPRGRVCRIKVISMGESGVGKSCLMKRYCEGKFISRYLPTIGVDYGVKAIEYGEYEVRVNLWDLAGDREYFDVRNEFYNGAQGCVLVYDTTDRASFDMLHSWVQESLSHGAREMVVVVAGTKTDVPSRKVHEHEGREWAASRGFLFFEVSSASGKHVVPLFSTLFARILATTRGIPEQLVSQAVQEAHRHRSKEECQLLEAFSG